MEIDDRATQSAFSLILQTVIRPFKPRLVIPKPTHTAGSPRLTPHKSATRSVKVVERKHGDIFLYDLTSGTHAASVSGTSTGLRMYYFAGGGWQGPPSSQHWKFCAELVQKIPSLTVTLVSPPLAPGSPAATTFPILSRLYASVLEEAGEAGERVIFAGDSSGGNLVLCLALHALKEDVGSPKPHALLVISPAVELRPTKKDGTVQTISWKDPVLTVESHDGEAKTWAQDVDPAVPWISPITADVSVLAKAGVKLIGVTGGWDILTPSALKFRDTAREQGVVGAWLNWDKQMHCYPLAFMYKLPEAVQAKDWIVEQMKKI
ncbi:Hormone-sensitive lipase [Elsinoe australis]|uniref:Hormone-sensitive lipase n=1 Tax=Elsinoe australis TaxID=40998 RepID=A0A2P7YL88_9PEZI|nr:Hormone-sensitive lipase [Elsinoe australis]